MSILRFDFSDSWFGPNSQADDQWNLEWDSVANILTDYIQPDSTLSLADAVHQVIQLWKASGSRFEEKVLAAPISMADQNPYDHPAHRNLAKLMLTLHDGGAWIDSNEIEDRRSAQKQFWETFDHNIYESDWRSDNVAPGTDPIEWANSCTFVANLTYSEHKEYRFNYYIAKSAFRDAIQISTRVIPGYREARIIAAAQFMILHAHMMLDEAIETRKREIEWNRARSWVSRLLRPKRDMPWDPILKFGWDEWQINGKMFGAAASNESYGGRKSKVCSKSC